MVKLTVYLGRVAHDRHHRGGEPLAHHVEGGGRYIAVDHEGQVWRGVRARSRSIRRSGP
jgi:hypothetical protein